MINGHRVVDAHVHAPHLKTLKPAWLTWADTFSRDHPWRDAYDEDGTPVPARLDALFDREGIDHVLLFSEYSPRATGIQSFDDLLALVDHNPDRFHPVANLNPHLHFPLVDELERQLSHGAVALKLHPVHGGFHPADKELFPVYARCIEERIPVIFHSGTSDFPGSKTRYGNPELYLDAIDHFPDLDFVFAHGGRGWWYSSAAFLAQSRPNVWLELSGLPPKKLPEYYRDYPFERLARRMIFGTDWPGVPGPGRNAAALGELGLPADVYADILSGNAARVYPRLGLTSATPDPRATQ